MGSGQDEHLINEPIRSNPEKATRLTGEFDVELLEDSPQRPMFLEDLFLRSFWKKIEADLNGTKFDGFVPGIKLQRDFTKIIILYPCPAHHPQVQTSVVKLLEGGSHVIGMHQQRFVRLRHASGIDFL